MGLQEKNFPDMQNSDGFVNTSLLSYMRTLSGSVSSLVSCSKLFIDQIVSVCKRCGHFTDFAAEAASLED